MRHEVLWKAPKLLQMPSGPANIERSVAFELQLQPKTTLVHAREEHVDQVCFGRVPVTVLAEPVDGTECDDVAVLTLSSCIDAACQTSVLLTVEVELSRTAHWTEWIVDVHQRVVDCGFIDHQSGRRRHGGGL